jgi:Flp pilus assembly protein TadG
MSKRIAGRRGAVLVYIAILLVPLTMFVALAVDVGVIATAEAQLKTAADAAALAGARQLASDRRISTSITNLTPEMTLATTKAISAGNANSVLGKPMQLNSSNVVIGYKKVSSPNPDLPDAAVNTGVSSTLFNSVQVTATVAVPALFSAPFRPGGSTVSVTSTATVELAQIKGFTIGSANANILPIVMDGAAYNRMVGGSGGDSYAFSSGGYNPPNSNGVTSGADGITESVVYPVSAGSSGNWGTIKFGVSNNSTATLGSQISNGITPAQMQAEYPASTNTVSVPHQFGANPGISAAVKSNLTGIIGQAVTVPIYDTSGGNGNNAWYHVYAFASVRIVAVNLTGNPKYVVVQPAISIDPTAIPDTANTNPWSAGGAIFLHLSR